MHVNKSYISVRFSEPHLRKRNKALSVLLDVSSFLSTSLSLQEILDGTLSKVLECFGLTSGRIYLVEEGENYLILASHKGIDSEGLERLKLSEGFSGKAVRTRSFIAQHVMELDDKDRVKLLTDKGVQMVICIPLIAMNRVLGVMNLAADRIIEFDEGEIDLLIAIGNQIAVATNNAKLYEDLNRKMKELKVQKDSIEFFAYSISHDLKSPAVGIYGLTNRLYRQYRSSLDEKGGRYCEQILKAAEQVARLVDRINAYIMAKEAVLHFESIPLKEITETIRNEFHEALSRRSVKWSEPEELPTITADRICLIRVLRNLVDNALKYGGEGLTEISIAYREESEHHIISVNDDGVALNVTGSDVLFQPFHRSRTSKGIEGTGLGLATVMEIAQRHNGFVWLDPCEKGTTFCLSIGKALEGSEVRKLEEEGL